MLQPNYLDGLSDDLIKIYSALEIDILRTIAKRMKKMESKMKNGYLSDLTSWQLQILSEAGGL